MSSSHNHAHPRGSALNFAFGANFVLLVGQVAGALLLGSVALLADSAHQATDVIGLAVAIVGFRIAATTGKDRYTYGMGRAEVLGGLVNAVLLVSASGWVLIEVARRIGDPPEVAGVGVAAIAVVGLCVNGASAFYLNRVAGENLNIRGAVTHLMADAVGSAGVLVAGLSAIFWDAHWVDPVVAIAIAIMVGVAGFKLLRDAARVLLEAAPTHADLKQIQETIEAQAEVTEAHHLHLWSLDSETTALTAHVLVGEDCLHDVQQISEQITATLKQNHGVGHTTLAMECHPCEDPVAQDHDHQH